MNKKIFLLLIIFQFSVYSSGGEEIAPNQGRLYELTRRYYVELFRLRGLDNCMSIMESIIRVKLLEKNRMCSYAFQWEDLVLNAQQKKALRKILRNFSIIETEGTLQEKIRLIHRV